MTKQLWSKNEDLYLIENYAFKSTLELASYLNRTYYAVADRANKFLKLTKSKEYESVSRSNRARLHSLNQNYFQDINTEEKAYWYGFIWADGSVRDKYYLRLTIQKGDIEHLKLFRTALKANDYEIKYLKKNCVELTVSSQKMINDLAKINIVRRKSYKDLKPIIDQKLFLPFLLGLIDGDGHISKYYINITNTEATCNFVIDELKKLKLIDTCKIHSTKSVAKRLFIYKKKIIKELITKMTSSCPIWLDRKKKKCITLGHY